MVNVTGDDIDKYEQLIKITFIGLIFIVAVVIALLIINNMCFSRCKKDLCTHLPEPTRANRVEVMQCYLNVYPECDDYCSKGEAWYKGAMCCTDMFCLGNLSMGCN